MYTQSAMFLSGLAHLDDFHHEMRKTGRHCDCEERGRTQSRRVQDFDMHGLLRRLRRLAMTPALYAL
jgi:hypothetical protein